MNIAKMGQNGPEGKSSCADDPPAGRWLNDINAIVQACEDRGLEINARQCQHMLATAQLPGVKFPGSNAWRSHTGLLDAHFDRLLKRAAS